MRGELVVWYAINYILISIRCSGETLQRMLAEDQLEEAKEKLERMTGMVSDVKKDLDRYGGSRIKEEVRLAIKSRLVRSGIISGGEAGV